MDFVSYLLFENPTTLWVILALAWLVTLILRRQTQSLRLGALLWVLPLIIVLLGILAHAVETEHESLLRTLRMMEQAADRGDQTAFMERVSDDYRTGTFGKEALARAVRIGLAHFRATASTPATQISALPDGTRVSRVTQEYTFRPAPGSQFPLPPQWQKVTWEGTFRKETDGQWRLTSAAATRPEPITAEDAAARLLSNPLVR
jgi:hypothetical protein